MSKIGRNSACPCGSGKKYKRCCLARDRLDERRWQCLDLAMDWLHQHDSEAVGDELCDHYWGPVGSALMSRHTELPEEVQSSLIENSDDWLVAQGELLIGEEPRPVTDLLLGPGGAPLDEVQRQWLESCAETPLGIYEVRELEPTLMKVVDLADPDRPVLRVMGRAVPPEADEDSALVGMRLVPEGGDRIRTVAWYPFERTLLPQLEELIARARAEGEAPEDQAWYLGSLIAALWWDEKARAHLSPEEIEAAWKSEFQPMTDLFRVVDWDRLSTVLAAADQVEGSRHLGWTHFERPANVDEDLWIHTLNPLTDDRLGLFAVSELQADEGREWLEDLAGDTVVFERREIRDPNRGEISGELLEGYDDAPAAEKTARKQAHLESTYERWAETPVPILDGKPPALAMRSEEGRQRVVELLERYERSEQEAARREQRGPVSYRFLWESLGLDGETKPKGGSAPVARPQGEQV